MKTCCGMLTLFFCLVTVANAKPVRPAPEKKNAESMITNKAQQAIDTGLAYLTKEQAIDGSFGTGAYKGNVAVTGLAGLALLSADPMDGDNEKIVTKAVRYVLSQQDKDGLIASKGNAIQGPMYGHGFATLFLADAHERVADKKLKSDAKEALERAVKLLIKAQNREGGWRYMPNSPDADISVTACQVAALRAARDAGIVIPQATLDNAANYVKRCQADGGGFRYQAGFGGGPGFSRTAAGVASLNRAGIKDGEAIDKGLKYLQVPDPKNNGMKNAEMQFHYYYGHYYAAKAMWYAGDKEWQKWYPAIRDELVRDQKDDRWQLGTMCPHYCTAMALIILQLPEARLASMKR
jgi:Prenyltransferase and squalene oxidase repeat